MKKITLIIMSVLVLGILGFLYLKGNLTAKAITDSTVEFTVNAYRFGYNPDTLTVNQGDKVKIYINNTDTLHGIRIPELGIKGDNLIEFTAEKKGEFVWYCANMCGKEHMQMQGRIIIN